MKLYVSANSPYARLAQVVAIEKGLAAQIEVTAAQTRTAGSPYYAVNPSGRVPYLAREDGPGLEDSVLICAYLDQLDGRPRFARAASEAGWDFGRLDAETVSFLDGLAVWARELRRPAGERSATIIAHEAERARRLADHWERQVDHPLMNEPSLNIPQIRLQVLLDFAAKSCLWDARGGRPALAAWSKRMGERPSLAATKP